MKFKKLIWTEDSIKSFWGLPITTYNAILKNNLKAI